jgi:hypothetical protein
MSPFDEYKGVTTQAPYKGGRPIDQKSTETFLIASAARSFIKEPAPSPFSKKSH